MKLKVPGIFRTEFHSQIAAATVQIFRFLHGSVCGIPGLEGAANYNSVRIPW